MCSWCQFLENAISDLNDKGYNVNHIAEMNFFNNC